MQVLSGGNHEALAIAQAAGAQQITEALATLTDGSRAAADALREFKDASQHMVSAVDGLTETVSRFRVDE